MSIDESKFENQNISVEEKEVTNKEAAEAVKEVEEKQAQATEVAVEVAEKAEKEVEEQKATEKVPSMDDYKDELDASFKKVNRGDTVECKVESVTEGEIVVSFGYSADGVIKKDQLVLDKDEQIADKYKVGDTLVCLVVKTSDKNGNVVLSHRRAHITVAWNNLEKKFNEKEKFTVKISEVVKGGLIARVDGVRAFMPASMSSNTFVEDLNEFIGKELVVEIKDFDKAARKVIISHKDIAIAEAKKAREDFFATVQAGDEFTGTVKKLMNFGAFVDLGPTDGLLHVNEMSWRRLKHPSEVVKAGDKVEVIVLNVDRQKGKLSLKLKNIEDNPWDTLDEKYLKGEIYDGEVVRLADFGAFVRLEEGVEGLVHISEISVKHIDTPASVLKVGESVKVKVLNVDKDAKKVGLSIRATLDPKPFHSKKKEVEPKNFTTNEKATTSLASVLGDLREQFK